MADSGVDESSVRVQTAATIVPHSGHASAFTTGADLGASVPQTGVGGGRSDGSGGVTRCRLGRSVATLDPLAGAARGFISTSW